MKIHVALLLVLFVVISIGCASRSNFNQALTGDAPIGEVISARSADIILRQGTKDPSALASTGIVINQGSQMAIVQMAGPIRATFIVEGGEEAIGSLPIGNYQVAITVNGKTKHYLTGAGNDKVSYRGQEFGWQIVIHR